MALNYRYNKKGKVTGIGWGKGPNAKAGAEKLKADNKKARSTTKTKKLSYEERQAQQDKAMRERAAKRHEQWKQDRKTKGKGNKSYNKGKPKSEWVDSAYERRQKDADKSMREAAAKRHDAWQKKNKRGKYSEKGKAKERAKQHSEGKDPNRGTNKKNLLVDFQNKLPWIKAYNKSKKK